MYGTLLLLPMLLTTTGKMKTLFEGIHVYLHGIAGLIEQRTAFMDYAKYYLAKSGFFYAR